MTATPRAPVESWPPPLLAGVLQTRTPPELKLGAGTVTIEGEQEVIIRAGRAAIRLRDDGDVGDRRRAGFSAWWGGSCG